jgi:hypothetical protein
MTKRSHTFCAAWSLAMLGMTALFFASCGSSPSRGGHPATGSDGGSSDCCACTSADAGWPYDNPDPAESRIVMTPATGSHVATPAPIAEPDTWASSDRTWGPSPPLTRPLPPGCPPPQTPPKGTGWGPSTPRGCQMWMDWCSAGLAFGCNAYLFCMTAGNSPQANCARACIQSNFPQVGSDINVSGGRDPELICEQMSMRNISCDCAWAREQSCIDACGARNLLPWGPLGCKIPPTLDNFVPACSPRLDIPGNFCNLLPGGLVPGTTLTCAQIVGNLQNTAPQQLDNCKLGRPPGGPCTQTSNTTYVCPPGFSCTTNAGCASGSCNSATGVCN